MLQTKRNWLLGEGRQSFQRVKKGCGHCAPKFLLKVCRRVITGH